MRSASGQWAPLSLEVPPGPVPLHTRSALFGSLAPGAYTVRVTTCQGEGQARPVQVVAGEVATLVFGTSP
ncbi:MAG: hypothetical protein NZ869_00970 [Thermoanaerobaculum sp.]|nr:hypothetical protein [Thermoanaerobaculum sp.]MDW7966994.1 hypothetical protein [Thermoanaerobaculum sp.]